MAIKTQGTNLYLINPTGPAVTAVACVTSIDGLDVTRDQIETTCLEAQDRTYEPGMKTPAAFTFGVNFDPATASHILLESLFQSGTEVQWAIALSDGTAAPTLDTNDDFDLPTTRTYITFAGYVASAPITIAQNDVLRSTFSVQPSGARTLTPKV